MFYLVVAVVSTRWIASAAAVGPSALAVWAIGLVALFIPLAFTVVELASRYPQEGGLYVWTQRAFGDYAGFLAGWLYWTSNLTYFPGLLYFCAASALFAFGAAGHALAASAQYFVTASLAGLALAVTLNVLGLGVGKWLQNVGAFGIWIPVALLIGAAAVAVARFGPATTFAPAAFVPTVALKDLVLWSTIAFAFAGVESVAFLGEEIHEPRRTLPRAIVWAGVAITAIYMLGTLAVLVALPAGRISGLEGLMQAIAGSAERVGAIWMTPAAALLAALGGLGAVGAWLASVGRLAYVAGIDRYLPPSFGELHPRWGTPHRALIAQGIGAAVFVLMSQAGTGVKGAYDVLVSLTVIGYFIPLLLMFAALIVLQREPAPPDVMRVPGGRAGAIVLGLLGIVTTGGSMVLAALPARDDPHPGVAVAKVIGGTVLLAAAGTLLYRRAGRRSRAEG